MEDPGDDVGVHFKINWGILRRQKRILADVAWGRRSPSPAEGDMLEGILNILDEIQDQAAEDLGEAHVFDARMPRVRGPRKRA